MADIVTKLLPILHVKDPHAERDFSDWSYRIVTVRSPSGMDVLFEEQPPSCRGIFTMLA